MPFYYKEFLKQISEKPQCGLKIGMIYSFGPNEAEDENGKVWKYIDETKLHIMRDGKEMDVLGSEILETDSIIEYTDLMK